MTKAQYIAKHGEAAYAAKLAARRTPEGRALRSAYMKRYYAAKHGGNVRPMKTRGIVGVRDGTYQAQYAQQPDVKLSNRDRARAIYQALNAAEKQLYRTKQNQRRREARAALKADLVALEAFKAKAREKHLAWRDENRDHTNAKSREWAQLNPEKIRAISIAATHKRRGGGKMNPLYVRFLKTQPCLDCGSIENIEIGHLIPLTKGGTNHPLNLVAQCLKCNRRLNAKVHPKAMMVHYIQAATFAA